MSSENERHPTALSDEEKAAMKKAFPAAFDADGEDAGDDTNPDGEDGTPAAQVGEDALPPAVAADNTGDAPAGGDPDKEDVPVSRKEFNGVLNELRETRKQLQQAKLPAESVRDFDGELKALDEKLAAEQQALVDQYDEGEIDATELVAKQGKLMTAYQADMRKVSIAETEHVAATALERQQANAAAVGAQQAWDGAIGAWKESNAEFLANPIRKNAVATLLEQFGADDSLSNEQVIAQVQAAAFEAFNWTRAPAAGAPATDPHAARNAADRKAAARASADTPPALDGGVGGRGAPGGVDLESLRPGEFSKLPRAEQEKLLGAGAL